MIATANFTDAWLYVTAPIAGAIVAALVHKGLEVLAEDGTVEVLGARFGRVTTCRAIAQTRPAGAADRGAVKPGNDPKQPLGSHDVGMALAATKKTYTALSPRPTSEAPS